MVSFSSKIKEELLRIESKAKHCQIAELSGIAFMLGRLETSEKGSVFTLNTDSDKLIKKFFTLLEKNININSNTNSLESDEWLDFYVDRVETLDKRIIWQNCCKQAFLRGAFLSNGSINNPEKSYHFEIVARDTTQVEILSDIMMTFGINPKSTNRKGRPIVYLKDASSIVEILGVMGASVGFMDMENARIKRQMRGDVNRQVNCETANITKTVSAAMKQIEDIDYISSTCGLSALPPGLFEVAIARREHPQMSLSELGGILNPPVGKSGVNHRLRRISEFAGKIKGRGINEEGCCD